MAGVWWLEKGRKGWGRCCILDPVRRRTEDTVEQHQICTDFIGVCCSMSVCVCVGMWRACGRAVLSSGQGVCVCVEGRQSWSIPPPPPFLSVALCGLLAVRKSFQSKCKFHQHPTKKTDISIKANVLRLCRVDVSLSIASPARKPANLSSTTENGSQLSSCLFSSLFAFFF